RQTRKRDADSKRNSTEQTAEKHCCRVTDATARIQCAHVLRQESSRRQDISGLVEKAPVNRHGSSVLGTAIHQLQDEDVVAPPMRLSQVRGCSQEKTPDFFCTNVVLQNHQCRNRSTPFIRASHSRTCSCPTRSYACLPRSAAV